MDKYFVSPKDKHGTCYYEFYKGKWDEKTFWKDDSICIDDDNWFKCDFANILIKYAPDFDPNNATEINQEQWEHIKCDAVIIGGTAAEIVAEAEEWMIDNFSKHDVFTILGI